MTTAAPDRYRGRVRAVPSRTSPLRHLRVLVRDDAAIATPPHERPATRADCASFPRPCPFVGCRHHLALEVKRDGALVDVFPDVAPDELDESCSLDAADRGEATLEEVGDMLNLTRERVRQIEEKALRKFRTLAAGRLG